MTHLPETPRLRKVRTDWIPHGLHGQIHVPLQLWDRVRPGGPMASQPLRYGPAQYLVPLFSCVGYPRLNHKV